MNIVHIRSDVNPSIALCGKQGPETVSQGHVKGHIVNLDTTIAECCHDLYNRLCTICLLTCEECEPKQRLLPLWMRR